METLGLDEMIETKSPEREREKSSKTELEIPLRGRKRLVISRGIDGVFLFGPTVLLTKTGTSHLVGIFSML